MSSESWSNRMYSVWQVIPLFLQLLSRIQGVRSLAQTNNDGQVMEDTKRPSKRPKTRRTWDSRAMPTTHFSFDISELFKKDCEGQWDSDCLHSSCNAFLCKNCLHSVLLSRLMYMYLLCIDNCLVPSTVCVTVIQKSFLNMGLVWMVDVKWYRCVYIL